MVITGFNLSAYFAIPLVLSFLAKRENIKVSLVENVHQVSTNQEMILSSRQLISTKTTPKTYYVSGTGNDKNSGLSNSYAFRTIQKAANLTNPGDTVLIMNGVYRNCFKYQSPEIKDGQIFANVSSDVRILRNILYAYPGKPVNSSNKNKNVICDYNIYLNSSKVSVKGTHDIVANSQVLKKYPTLEKISGDWKWRLDKQNPPMQTYVEPDLLGFACGSVTYRLKGKIIKVGCSR